MVEELKLAIKVDDDSIEQSLLKQFANAQKMADKVVLDFKNVNFDDKEIEAKFKALQKKAGQNPIDLSISNDSIQMLSQISDKLGDIFKIAQGKSIIDSSSTNADIGKIENKLNELVKKYEDLQKKASGGISGKEVNLVDNDEFKKLSANFEKIKGEVDDLKTHMALLSNSTVSGDSFVKLGSQVDGLSVKLNDLLSKYAELANIQSKLDGNKTNISSGDADVKQQETYYKSIANELTNIQDRHEGTHLIVNEIGKSESQVLSLILKENEEISKGNKLWQERQIYTDKYGNVVASYKGDKNEIGLGKSNNISIGNPIKETHIHPYNENMAGSYSIGDVYNMQLAFLQGIKEFEFRWRDEILSIDVSKMDSQSLLSLADNYENFFAGVQKVMYEVYQADKQLAIDKGQNLKNSYLAELVQNRGGTAKLYAQNSDGTRTEKEFMAISNAERVLVDTTGQYAIKLSELNEKSEEYQKTAQYILGNRKQLADYYKELGLISSSTSIDNSLKNQTELVDNFTNAFHQYISAYEDYYGRMNANDGFGLDAARKTMSELERIYPELKSARESGYTKLSDSELLNSSLSNYLERVQVELKSTESQAEKTAQAVKDVSSTASEKDLKDAIQVDDSSATNASTSAIKEENNVLEQTSQSAEKAANSKKKFAKSNQEVKASADASKSPIKEESDALEEVADSTNQLNVVQAKSDSTYWQNRFKESVKDMTSTNDELVKMRRYYQDMSNEAQKAYDVFEKKKNSYSDKLTGYTDTTKYTSDFVNHASSLKDEVVSLAFTKPQDVARLQEIDKEVVQISNDSKLLENKLVKQQSKLAEIVSQMKIFKSQNTNMSSSQKAELEQIIKYADTMQKSGKKVASEFEDIKVRFSGLKAEVHATGNTGKNFFSQISDRLTDMNSKFVAQFLSWQDWIRYIQKASQTVVELNTNITELSKVSEASVKDIYNDFSSYADIAKDIGGTISDTISATADWSRNGYSLPEAKELAEVAQLYKNVGDGIDIDTANESLISTLRGFQLEADQAEHIIDVFNEVSNNEPIDSGGIGQALQRSAASFNAANTSLEQSVALVTATNSVLQDPEKVGNMWKTVSARIRGADVELKDMGEDTDGMVESTSKLRDLVKGMTGFDIMKDDDTFKDIYEIVIGIGEQWDKLSDVNRANECPYVQKCA